MVVHACAGDVRNVICTEEDEGDDDEMLMTSDIVVVDNEPTRSLSPPRRVFDHSRLGICYCLSVSD